MLLLPIQRYQNHEVSVHAFIIILLLKQQKYFIPDICQHGGRRLLLLPLAWLRGIYFCFPSSGEL